MLQFTCGCGQALKVSDDLAGWKTKCPGCKQLISVPGPDDEPAEEIMVERTAAQVPWKGIAIGASAVAVIAIIVAIASAGGGSAPREDAEGETSRLKRKIKDLEKEVDEMTVARVAAPDAAKLTERAKSAEAERDRLKRDLETAHRQLAEMRASAAASKPSPPIEASASPPATPPTAPPAAPSAGSGDSGSATAVTPAEIPKLYSGAMVLVQSDAETGGGFFVSMDGLIVTSYRAIARSEVRRVTYVVDAREGVQKGRMTSKAAVVAVDRKNDLALLKISVPHLVPIVTLEEQFALGGGQEVMVLGTPMADSESVEISVMRGKVLDVWAPAQGKPFIKTTVPVTSKVAGVPAFNVMGRAVGVTRVAPTVGDEDGYVIPAAHVRALIDGRETTFAVKGSLAEWESKGGKNQGEVAGAEPSPIPEHPKGIRVAGHVVKLLVDDENDRIVAMIPQASGVSVVSISRRKVLRSIQTGSEPTDIQAPVRPDVVWVSHAGSQNLVKVDVEEGKIYDRVNVTSGFSQFVATRHHLWVFGTGDSGVLTLQDKTLTTSPIRFGALAYDRRKDTVVGISLSLGNTKMVEFDPDKVGPLVKVVMEIKADSKHPRRDELPDLLKDLDNRIKRFTPPAECAELMVKGFRILMVADRSPNLYLARSILKRDKMETVLASIPVVLFENKHGRGVSETFDTFGDRPHYIHAGSPNGKWVATGTHIYNTESYAVHKELPIPTPTAAFSSDSKTLYIYDLSTQSIIPVDVE